MKPKANKARIPSNLSDDLHPSSLLSTHHPSPITQLCRFCSTCSKFRKRRRLGYLRSFGKPVKERAKGKPNEFAVAQRARVARPTPDNPGPLGIGQREEVRAGFLRWKTPGPSSLRPRAEIHPRGRFYRECCFSVGGNGLCDRERSGTARASACRACAHCQQWLFELRHRLQHV